MIRTVNITSNLNVITNERKNHDAGPENLDDDLLSIVELLAADKKLPLKNRSHQLCVNWQDHRGVILNLIYYLCNRGLTCLSIQEGYPYSWLRALRQLKNK